MTAPTLGCSFCFSAQALALSLPMHYPRCTTVPGKALEAAVGRLGRQERPLGVYEGAVEALGADAGLEVGDLQLLGPLQLALGVVHPLLVATLPHQPGVAAFGRLADHGLALAGVEHLAVVGDDPLDVVPQLVPAQRVLLIRLLFVAQRRRLFLGPPRLARRGSHRKVLVLQAPGQFLIAAVQFHI